MPSLRQGFKLFRFKLEASMTEANGLLPNKINIPAGLVNKERITMKPIG